MQELGTEVLNRYENKMTRYEIIQVQGEVQMMKRDWWQLYKRGWHKHKDFWNRRWWIRFKWGIESNISQQNS